MLFYVSFYGSIAPNRLRFFVAYSEDRESRDLTLTLIGEGRIVEAAVASSLTAMTRRHVGKPENRVCYVNLDDESNKPRFPFLFETPARSRP